MSDKEETTKNVYQRLIAVQKEAVAPRAIRGKFGMARSAEQILEAYKPVCRSHGLYLFTDDKLVTKNGRNYIRSTATVVNVDDPTDQHSSHAYAWENEVGRSSSGNAILDTSQVTGKTGSYAKKYALQNLFAIDDTKDADFEHDEPKVKKTPARMPKSDEDSEAAELARAKVAINRAMEARGFDTAAAKQALITSVIGHDSIDNLNEANRIADKLEMK